MSQGPRCEDPEASPLNKWMVIAPRGLGILQRTWRACSEVFCLEDLMRVRMLILSSLIRSKRLA